MSLQLINRHLQKLQRLVANNTHPITVVGCDPGPEYSAFVEITVGLDGYVRCDKAAYVSNDSLKAMNGVSTLGDLYLTPRDPSNKSRLIFAYERVSNQGRVVGKLVFDTCAISGDICRHMRHDMLSSAIASFTPSRWRYIITGLGNAKDSETRVALDDFGVSGLADALSTAAKTAKREYKLTKSSLPHLRDAAGVALSVLLVWDKLGDDSNEHILWPLGRAVTGESNER